ncbi:SRPBCC family protein [Candidatus Viadribacter manganicus]|nr:SRPBCC domain-containing protein [Candidatus Viadribacter manganicus]
MLRLALLSLMLGLASPAYGQSAERIIGCARSEANGTRTLCHEVVVAASTDEVWQLFASSAGMQTWLAPLATMDLRVGGLWETSYRADARAGDPGNIRNRVLSFIPGRMLSIAVDRAPEGFPEPELVRDLWTVIELEAVDASHTRVAVSMMGFASNPGHERLYQFFQAGNALTLQMLEQRIVTGPTDWAALAARSRP